MAVLFVSRVINFSGNTAAGSGTVSRGLYTVPAGKRAVLVHSLLAANANAGAANLGSGRVLATIGGTAITVHRETGFSGLAIDSYKDSIHSIDLSAGDTVDIQSINTSAVIIVMTLNAVIREYL